MWRSLVEVWVEGQREWVAYRPAQHRHPLNPKPGIVSTSLRGPARACAGLRGPARAPFLGFDSPGWCELAEDKLPQLIVFDVAIFSYCRFN